LQGDCLSRFSIGCPRNAPLLTFQVKIGDAAILHYDDLRERNVDLFCGRVVELKQDDLNAEILFEIITMSSLTPIIPGHAAARSPSRTLSGSPGRCRHPIRMPAPSSWKPFGQAAWRSRRSPCRMMAFRC